MTWTTTRLKHVARVGYGLSQPPALSETGIPILRATNITRGRFTADGLIFAAREHLPLDRAPLLREGEILVVRSGAYTGDSAMVTSAWAGSAPGYDLRVSPASAHPAYIAYCLLSNVALDQMDLARSRAAQPHLNAEDLGDVTVRVPPIDEQRRIAGYLDAETARIDVLLAATDRQIELLNHRRLGALRAMTTGIAEHIPSAATGIRWMPLIRGDWKLFKVGNSFKTGSGTTPRSSEPRYFDGPYPWINTADLHDGLIQDPARSVSAAALREYPALRVYPPGTLMVAMYGATTGRVGINVAPACVNQACCALTPLGPVTVTYALYWFIAHRTELVQLASGGGQPNISQDLVRSLRIPAPDSVAEQRKIGQDCDAVEEENAGYRSRLARRSVLLAERRQALITAAVTGQIDVTTVRGAVRLPGGNFQAKARFIANYRPGSLRCRAPMRSEHLMTTADLLARIELVAGKINHEQFRTWVVAQSVRNALGTFHGGRAFDPDNTAGGEGFISDDQMRVLNIAIRRAVHEALAQVDIAHRAVLQGHLRELRTEEKDALEFCEFQLRTIRAYMEPPGSPELEKAYQRYISEPDVNR